jgi:hypothetical protein
MKPVHVKLGGYLTILGFMIQGRILNNIGLHDTLGGYLTILIFMIHWDAIYQYWSS